jgi:hypothetical protein
MERPVLPAHQPTEVAPTYQPTEVAPSYQPTEVAPSHQPTVPPKVPPPHEPTTVEPRRQDAASSWNPTVTGPQVPPYDGSWDQATVIRPSPSAAPTVPPVPPTGPDPGSPLAPHQFPSTAAPPSHAPELVRYGPGVPPSQAGVSAEQVWRTGQIPDPPRRPVRVRRLASLALTVILLAAAGVLLFLRFHHTPFHVTGAPTLSSAQNGCTVNVTGQIPTNGSSGTISYQWVFTPQSGAPQPLSQSVVSGQHDVFVTVAVQGQGHGTASEQVTLQILGPNQESTSNVVKVSC